MKRYFSELAASLLKLNILVVDHNQAQLRVFTDIIENDCKQTALGINNAEQAIAMVQEKISSIDMFDAVFVDYMLPEMNGLELSRELYKIDPGLSLVILSTDGSIKTKCELAVFSEIATVIVKGDSTETLARLLCMFLSKKRMLMNGNEPAGPEEKEVINTI